MDFGIFDASDHRRLPTYSGSYSPCVVPGGSNGPMAIWIISDSQPIPNDVVQSRRPNNVVAGPTPYKLAPNGFVVSHGSSGVVTRHCPLGRCPAGSLQMDNEPENEVDEAGSDDVKF